MFSTGVDKNGDNELSASEVLKTSYVCDGSDQVGSACQVTRTDNYVTIRCGNSEQRVYDGKDGNSCTVIPKPDIDAIQITCGKNTSILYNGKDGIPGKAGEAGYSSLMNTCDPPAGSCPNGGIKFHTGLDLNFNHILDVSEIRDTKIVCEPNSAKLMMTTERFRTPNSICQSGLGAYINVGYDKNGNNVLDPEEITSRSFVCDGKF